MMYSIQLQLMLAVFFAKVTQIKLNSSLRLKRAPDDKFKALLHLYRMNPLKHSGVYEKLSNRLLSRHGTINNRDNAINLDSKEYTEEWRQNPKVKLKYVEKSIYNPSISHIYNASNIETENFDSHNFLHGRKHSKHNSVESHEQYDKVLPNIDLLLGYLAPSTPDEEDNKVILNEMRPKNRTVNNRVAFKRKGDGNSITDEFILVKTKPRKLGDSDIRQGSSINSIPDIQEVVVLE